MTALLPGPETRALLDCHEARGQLLSVFCRDGFAVASFAWGCMAFPEELEERLRGLIGRKCAILKLDGRYFVRDLEGEDHAA